ncbi:MAG: hypothetical protein CBC35_07135 [Planctomycetes bacterium TMED75]|nr:MAG: hypothetical protein CBC35_07135 [Planctomycetes bacterium TMED75]
MNPTHCFVLLSVVLGCPGALAETIYLRDQLGSLEVDHIAFETGGVRLINHDLISDPDQLPDESDDSLVPDPDEPAPSGEDSPSGSSPEAEMPAPVRGRLLAWDQVRSIEGIEDPVLAAEWARWQPVATDLWRARSRLQRGDRTLSAPLFERHFGLFASDLNGSEMGLIVAEGLLRSRLRSGAIEALLPAALETVRLRRAGFSTDRYQEMPPVLDEQLWLVPRLAPIPTQGNLDSKSMRSLLDRWLGSPDPVVAEIARAYARMHDPPDFLAEGIPAKSTNLSGAALLSAAIATGASDPQQRSVARDRFQSLLRTRSAGTPLDSWRGWFMGVSGILDQDSSLDVALLELLSIPALHLHDDPALSVRAIEVCADALEKNGRIDEAAVLRQEIERLDFKVDPALLPVVLGTDTSSSDVSSEEDPR